MEGDEPLRSFQVPLGQHVSSLRNTSTPRASDMGPEKKQRSRLETFIARDVFIYRIIGHYRW